jgi:uncharacterized protein YfaS (alpha-2-macroglobulin family)
VRRDDAESPARPIAARAPHATRTRTLPVALTADAPGTVSFALVCAGRVAAQGTAKLAAAGTVGFRLKLPKKLKAGIYQLKITFGGNARTIKITFVGAKKARKARAAAGRR